MNKVEMKNEILKRLQKDGVNLQEFSAEHQARIIKTYAAVLLTETK